MKPLFEDDPYYRMMQLIDAIHVKSRKYAERRIRPLNMTYPQLAALMVLNIQDGLRQRELADMLETDTTTVTVLCDSLQKRGWINRIADSSDRRLKRIVLTDAGRNAYADALQKLHSGLGYMHERTPDEESRKAMPFLEKLHENISSLLDARE